MAVGPFAIVERTLGQRDCRAFLLPSGSQCLRIDESRGVRHVEDRLGVFPSRFIARGSLLRAAAEQLRELVEERNVLDGQLCVRRADQSLLVFGGQQSLGGGLQLVRLGQQRTPEPQRD